MKLRKLQLDLFKYITSDKQIKELEDRKAHVVERREAIEELESVLARTSIAEFAVIEWNRLYKEELELELQIINLKKFQTEFMLERMLAD
jgi:hypothetical protein